MLPNARRRGLACRKLLAAGDAARTRRLAGEAEKAAIDFERT